MKEMLKIWNLKWGATLLFLLIFPTWGAVLKAPSFDLPITYNGSVIRWIQYFQGPGQKWFEIWLQRSTRYIPFLQAELKKSGLPQDFVYLVMIESGFSPRATSKAGAVGLWQFMPATGKKYGLRIDEYVDERMDPYRSTRAAISYLKDLYQEFGNWYLVAASYNMGENGIRRLIQKYKTRNYWKLIEYGALPKETQEYVPKILAAALISKAPGLYGFQDISFDAPLNFEILSVPPNLSLEWIADVLDITETSLIELNPSLKKKRTPPYSYQILTPPGAKMVWQDRAFGKYQARREDPPASPLVASP